MKYFPYIILFLGFLAFITFVFIQIQNETNKKTYLKGFESGVSSVKIPDPIPLPEKGCVTGYFLTDGWIEGSYMKFGEMQMCAEIVEDKIIISSGDLIAGPDYSAVFSNLENELSKWKDCADSILLCPPGFKRAEP